MHSDHECQAGADRLVTQWGVPMDSVCCQFSMWRPPVIIQTIQTLVERLQNTRNQTENIQILFPWRPGRQPGKILKLVQQITYMPLWQLTPWLLISKLIDTVALSYGPCREPLPPVYVVILRPTQVLIILVHKG